MVPVNVVYVMVGLTLLVDYVNAKWMCPLSDEERVQGTADSLLPASQSLSKAECLAACIAKQNLEPTVHCCKFGLMKNENFFSTCMIYSYPTITELDKVRLQEDPDQLRFSAKFKGQAPATLILE